MANSPSGESLITRVVRLLAVFPAHNAPLPVRVLSEEAQLPLSTTYRLLRELEDEDLVARTEGGLWQQGNRLWEIASKGSHAQTLRDAALPPMEDLAANLHAHVSIGILDRNEVLYLERLNPHEKTVNIISVATRLPAHATSSGLVLTAFGPPEGRDLMLRRNLQRYTDATITEPAKLREAFARARRDGFVTSSGAMIPESTGISVPVFTDANHVIAAVTVIVPLGEENLNVIVPQMRLCARAIQRRHGSIPHDLLPMDRQTNPEPENYPSR